MKKVKYFLIAIALASPFMSLAAVTPVTAVDVFEQCEGQQARDNPICQSRGDDLSQLIQNIINVALGLIGLIAVIFIIVGGFRYVTSHGDSTQVSAAKNTIMYAVIGLVIALSAYAIVNFVISNI